MAIRNITDKIIVHCTATPEGREVTVQEIDRWHRKAGYNGIGYHYIVHLDGKVEKGRDERQIGAHTVGQNLLKELKQRYPVAKIYGHRDFARKACPSFDAKEEYKNI